MILNRLLLLNIQFFSKQMDSKQFYRTGGRHKSNTIDMIEYEKVKPETLKFVKARKGKWDSCGRSKSKIFTK